MAGLAQLSLGSLDDWITNADTRTEGTEGTADDKQEALGKRHTTVGERRTKEKEKATNQRFLGERLKRH